MIVCPHCKAFGGFTRLWATKERERWRCHMCGMTHDRRADGLGQACECPTCAPRWRFVDVTRSAGRLP